MAKVSSTKATAQGNWQYGSASGDQFAKEDLQNMAKNFEFHVHDETATANCDAVKIRTFGALSSVGDVACLAAADNSIITQSVTGGSSRGYLVVAHATFLDTSGASNDVTIKMLDQGSNVVAQATGTCTASKTINLTCTALWTPSASGTWTLAINGVGVGTAKQNKCGFSLIRYT